MDFRYRPLLPPTQTCQCDWLSSTATANSSLREKRNTPFFRALFAPYTPLWIDEEPRAVTDDEELASINFRAAFERRKKMAARLTDATTLMSSLYEPKGKWAWMHQTPIHDRPEEIVISSPETQYSLCVKAARVYEERITYIRKLWFRDVRWKGFFCEAALFKVPLRPLQGIVVPALIGIHSNIKGTQLSFDIPHHSFWIQASPDMPDILKRRCLEAYEQLHGQGILHGSVALANILIGGDGQVKLINFEKSRSAKGYPELHLGIATPQDLRLEMREVHYKLDYQGARRKEHLNYAGKANKPRTQLTFTSQYKILQQETPFSVLLDPPVDPGPSDLNWFVPDDWSPKRFVVPGQSLQQFERHLERFLSELEESTIDGREGPSALRSRPHSPAPPLAITSKQAGGQENAPIVEGNNQRYNLRKRKQARCVELDTDVPARKRVRFLATTRHSDGTKAHVRSPPPVGVKRHVPRISREHLPQKDVLINRTPIFTEVNVTPTAATTSSLQSPSHPRNNSGAMTSSPRSPFPEYSPSLDYERIFSVWKSINASSYNSEDRDRDERVTGKKRRIDDTATFPVVDEQTLAPRSPKRLRRTESVVFETSGPIGSGSSAYPHTQPPTTSYSDGSSRTISRTTTLGLQNIGEQGPGSHNVDRTQSGRANSRLYMRARATHTKTILAGQDEIALAAGPSTPQLSLSPLEKVQQVAVQLSFSIRTAADVIGDLLGLW